MSDLKPPVHQPTPTMQYDANSLDEHSADQLINSLATVVFILPFPPSSHKVKHPDSVPPFALYAPLAPRLVKPPEGQKESLLHKAQRKWQTEEEEARSGTNLKAKAVKLISKGPNNPMSLANNTQICFFVGMSMTKNSQVEFLIRTPNKKELKEMRMLYPTDYNPERLKEDFLKLVVATKKGTMKNSIIATMMMPVALAFDTLTFIPGPFEITAVWAASSVTGAQRASSIASGITSESVPLGFIPEANLNPIAYRLHELCWKEGKKGLFTAPIWNGEGSPKRGTELADIIIADLRQHLGEEVRTVDLDRTRIAEDLEEQLKKASKEYTKAVTD